VVERFLPAGPTLGYGARQPPTPLQYYTSGAERLRVSLSTILSSANLIVSGRTWDAANGDVIPFQREITTTSGYPPGRDYECPLPAGALLNVRIGSVSTNLPPGFVFARLQLIQGSGATATVLSTLAQGFVSTTSDVGWPGSPIEPIGTGRGFLANVGWTLATGPLRATTTVPSGFRYLVIGANLTFVASGVVADRSLHTQLLDPGGETIFTGAGAAALPAGSAVSVNVLPAMGPSQISVSSVLHLPWPPDLDLTSGYVLRVFVNNEQAGDAITPHGLLVREWMDF
jgi:hypothetical protein